MEEKKEAQKKKREIKFNKYSALVFFTAILGGVFPFIIYLQESTLSNYDVLLKASNIEINSLKDSCIGTSELKTVLKKYKLSNNPLDSLTITNKNNREIVLEVKHTIKSKDEKSSYSQTMRYVFVGFYSNPFMIIWPLIFVCLGVIIIRESESIHAVLWIPKLYDLLLFINKWLDHTLKTLLAFEKGSTANENKWLNHTLKTASVIVCYVIFRLPDWIRNSLSNPKEFGRIMYTYANLDISFYGFLTQEAMALIMFILMLIIFKQWKKNNIHLNRYTDFFSNQLHEEVSKTFSKWQINALLLALAFFPLTLFFYQRIFFDEDKRYIMSAVIYHIAWLVLWIQVSQPMIKLLFNWNNLKNQAILQLRNEPEAVKSLEIIKEIQPIGFWQIMTSSVISFITFFTPLFSTAIKNI